MQSALRHARIHLGHIPKPLPSSYVLSTRYSSDKASQISQEVPGSLKSGWTTIYRFPYIAIVSALNKTKWYQLGATALGCPLAYAMQVAGEVGPGTAAICAAVGISATAATTVFSKLSSGTVGFFYLSEDQPYVARFAYVDSNGRRQDVVSSVDQVHCKEENRFFMRISVNNGETQLKLFHSHGIIVDAEKFNQVL